MACTVANFSVHALKCLFCALVFCVLNDAASGQGTGTNQRQAKDEATAAIPMGQLNPVAQQKTREVLNRASLYRRLPITNIEADPDYYRFLVRNPEVIVDIWRLMGVTKMVCKRTGDFTFQCDDGAGTVSQLELLYGTENLHLYWGSGSYEGPLNKRPLRGDCILLLRTESKTSAEGKPVVQSTLDVFLKIDNATATLVAKTLQPIVGRTADHNFVESLNFVQRLNETTGKNGPGVQGMASRLDSLSEPVRQQFIDIAEIVFQRTQFAHSRNQNVTAASTQNLSLPNPNPLNSSNNNGH